MKLNQKIKEFIQTGVAIILAILLAIVGCIISLYSSGINLFF